MRSVILTACLALWLGCTTEVEVPRGSATSERRGARPHDGRLDLDRHRRESCVDVYGRSYTAASPPNQCPASVVVASVVVGDVFSYRRDL